MKLSRHFFVSIFFIFFIFASLSSHNLSAVIGPPAELYANQLDDDLTKTYLTAISKSNRSVLLIMYSLTDPQIIEALKKKSERGVSVKVICDARASPYIDSKLGPKVDVVRRFGPGLMHQKILVVDSKKTWIGSANMTTDSLCLQDNLVAGIDSKPFAAAIHAKAKTVDVEGHGPPFLHQDFNVGGQNVELWFLPDNKDALMRLKTLIRGAKKNLRVAMFTWTRQDLAKEVIATAQRGVITKVLIDNSSGKGVSEKIVKYLKENGVQVALSPAGAPLLHHKFMVIDGKTLVNGSANWTRSAFSENDDCFIVINDLSDDQRKKVNNMWKKIWKQSVQ
jgi:phosphatidylserine/phosphatidylglycerophosphate/cardiolipin synthase-like enzyme